MSEMRFDGRVALVTGAGRGMGRDFAAFLASRGAKIVVCDAGVAIDGGGLDGNVAEEAAAALRAAGGEAVAHSADLTLDDGPKGAVRHALEAYGRLDIVIHNAGIALSAAFAHETPARMDKLLGINTRAACILAQEAWKPMQDAKYGRIVLIGSTAMYGMEGAVHYAMSKASYLGLCRSIANEGAVDGIKVNLVAPSVATRLADTLAESEFKTWFFNTMRPEMVTPLVAYLAHESCAVSGEGFAAAGGRIARIVLGECAATIDPTLTAEKMHALIPSLMGGERIELYRDYNESAAALMSALGYHPGSALGSLMQLDDVGDGA